MLPDHILKTEKKHRLEKTKAAGVAGIRGEHVSLDAFELLLHPLVQTPVLKQGVPPAWCTVLMYPIFKAGGLEDAADYQGIAVVNRGCDSSKVCMQRC